MPRRIKSKKEIKKEIRELTASINYNGVRGDRLLSILWDYRGSSQLNQAFNKLYKVREEKRETDIAKLKSLYTNLYNAIARHKRQFKGQSLAELIINGSGIELSKQRWCSRNGRELKIDFKMYRVILEPQTKKYMTECIMVHTPAMIGLRRVQGYSFDGEYNSFLHASQQSRWGVMNRGIFYKEKVFPNDSEVSGKASKFRDRIKDTLKAVYVDSLKKNVYNLKLKDVFILNMKPRVNKKEYRKHVASTF